MMLAAYLYIRYPDPDAEVTRRRVTDRKAALVVWMRECQVQLKI